MSKLGRTPTCIYLPQNPQESIHYSFKLQSLLRQSTTSSKPNCPHSAIQRFSFPASFHFPIPFIDADVFFLVFHSLLPSVSPPVTCLRRQFIREIWPSISPSFLLLFLFPSSLTLCNTSSFRTHSVQLMYIFLHHHISELSSHF